MSRNKGFPIGRTKNGVAPRKGRVSRNFIKFLSSKSKSVAPRKGRVSRNASGMAPVTTVDVAPRKGRVSRNHKEDINH